MTYVLNLTGMTLTEHVSYGTYMMTHTMVPANLYKATPELVKYLKKRMSKDGNKIVFVEDEVAEKAKVLAAKNKNMTVLEAYNKVNKKVKVKEPKEAPPESPKNNKKKE